MEYNNKLTWSENETDELWYHGEFDADEECILDAKENHEYTGDTIAIGNINRYIPHVDICGILESIEEAAYDEFGEAAEDWSIEVTEKEKEKLDKLEEEINKAVNKFIDDIGSTPNFYNIINIRTVKLK